MKQENFESPVELIRQVDNVSFLLNDTIPWMEANPDRVDFNEGNTECGMFACVGGWYCIHRYSQTWNEREWAMLGGVDFINHEFGIHENSQWCGIFGLSGNGGIHERKDRIQAHLHTLNQQIADWYAERELTAESAGVVA